MSSRTLPREERRIGSGQDLRTAIITASTWLDAQAERINALNVFPVPDGDTGTNMSMTLRASAEALSRLPETATVAEVARAAYEAAMMGARGNSGVILSQLLRGFSHALEGVDELTPTLLANALADASEVAYRGVSRPVEGTILTVARKSAEAARAAEHLGEDLTKVLEHTTRAAQAAVDATPDQLPVLRKAGVVDSGGEGFRVILEGAWMWSTGRAVADAVTAETHFARPMLDDSEEDGPPFGFCTEFLLRDCDLPVAEVKSRMDSMGESVIAVGDRDLLRVHVHTLRPGLALEFAVDHGTVAKIKVENMLLQHQEMAAAARADSDSTEPVTATGVIAVAPGEGFQKVFRSLGATVVQGGQTMNPSVQEIVSAVSSSGYRELIILPNNSNIVLTARHARDLTPHPVEVIPTVTAPQGIAALLAFNYQSDLSANMAAMQQAAEAVHTIEVTRAVRDAEVDGLAISAGAFMGILDGTVVVAPDSADAALLDAFERSSTRPELVTIYFGADATQAQADVVAGRLRDARAGIEVEVVAGGQPHYPYIVSLE